MFTDQQRSYILKYGGHPKAVRLASTAAKMRARAKQRRTAQAQRALSIRYLSNFPQLSADAPELPIGTNRGTLS